MTDDPFGAPPKRGNRISLLPIARYCGQAGKLSEAHGSGRAAAKSRAFHARAASSHDEHKLWAALDPEEREEVLSWVPVGHTVDANGQVLKYSSAMKEIEVQLVSPSGVVSIGHVDFAWIVDIPRPETAPDSRSLAHHSWCHGTTRVIYVGDIKKTRWTTLDGPASLQLMGYGIALAQHHGADYFVPGLWIAESGEWIWHHTPIAMFGDNFEELLSGVHAAMENTDGEFSTGQHCRDCYGRFHCPEHTLHAITAQTYLRALAAGEELTEENALPLLLAYQAGRDFFDPEKSPIQEALEAFAQRHGGIKDPKTGKTWLPVQVKGRPGVNKRLLVAELGDEANKYLTTGAPYFQHRWIKTGE